MPSVINFCLAILSQGCKWLNLGLNGIREDKKKENKKVIIIGAGASGIATAERLKRGGETDFLVLEATDRMCGRVKSAKVGKREERVEFGAQWIHGAEGNIVYELAKRWDMLENTNQEREKRDREEDSLYISEGGKRIDSLMINQFEKEFYRIFKESSSLNHEESKKYNNKGDFFTASLKEMLKGKLHGLDSEAWQYLHWYGRFMAQEDAAPSWWEIAAHGDQVYKECPGSQVNTFSKETNYQAFIEKLGSEVMGHIVLGEPVIRVTQLTNDRVEVETRTTIYQCDYAVVTVSLGVLKNKLIEFFPSLPQEKTNAIESMGFGLAVNVYLEYADDVKTIFQDLPEFPNGLNFMRRQENEEQSRQSGNLTESQSAWQDSFFMMSPDHVNPRLMVLFLQGSDALTVESLPESSLLTSISSFLSEYLPLHPLSKPISVTTTKWGTENTTFGTYSYFKTGTPQTAPTSLASPVGSILFAGEATHLAHYSTVHGAVESGWREAERIIDREEN